MKLYMHTRPAQPLFVSVPDVQPLMIRSGPPPASLYIGKANPNRDPAIGTYIGGGSHKGMKEGQQDLSKIVSDLMSQIPGENLKKDGY